MASVKSYLRAIVMVVGVFYCRRKSEEVDTNGFNVNNITLIVCINSIFI